MVFVVKFPVRKIGSLLISLDLSGFKNLTGLMKNLTGLMGA
jgi:hypothetical protein